MTFARCRQPELMDDPSLDDETHRRALAGLRRVNQWSLAARIIWNTIRKHFPEVRGRTLRILDVACGGGDVSLEIASRAAAAGYQVELVGCDISRLATTVAQERRKKMQPHLPISMSLMNLDVVRDSLPTGFDVVFCSLFLHHLDEPQAVSVLANMRQAATSLVLVDDLRRTWFGYVLAWAGSRVLSRSCVVHVDGPLSVAGAYTSQEAVAMAAEAGMAGATARHHWPQRFILEWTRPQ